MSVVVTCSSCAIWGSARLSAKKSSWTRNIASATATRMRWRRASPPSAGLVCAGVGSSIRAGRDDEVVVLPQQVRQPMSIPGAPAQPLGRRRSQQLVGVPQVLDALAPLVEALVGGVIAGRAHAAPAAAVGAPQTVGQGRDVV